MMDMDMGTSIGMHTMRGRRKRGMSVMGKGRGGTGGVMGGMRRVGLIRVGCWLGRYWVWATRDRS